GHSAAGAHIPHVHKSRTCHGYHGMVPMLATVERTRREIVDILDGSDDPIVVLVGPCSIRDADAAIEYAHRLAGGRASWTTRAWTAAALPKTECSQRATSC